jgi:hypothetical protein
MRSKRRPWWGCPRGVGIQSSIGVQSSSKCFILVTIHTKVDWVCIIVVVLKDEGIFS